MASSESQSGEPIDGPGRAGHNPQPPQPMTLRAASWNMKEGRPPGRKVVEGAADEVESLLDDYSLDVATLHEAKRYSDAVAGRARPAGYRVIRKTRDDSARDSLILVRKGIGARWPQLHRLERRGWERRDGRGGLHNPRSAVSVLVGWSNPVRVLAVHLPPTPGLAAYPLRNLAHGTSMATLERIGRRWNRRGRAWVMTGDWNIDAGHRQVRALADSLGAKVVGNGIDFALVSGAQITNMRRVRFGGSDHEPVLFDLNHG